MGLSYLGRIQRVRDVDATRHRPLNRLWHTPVRAIVRTTEDGSRGQIVPRPPEWWARTNRPCPPSILCPQIEWVWATGF